MSINDRIKILIDLLAKGRQNVFAEATNIKTTTINGIVGTRGNDPSFSTLKKIIDTYPNIDLNWLMKGEGRPLTTSDDPGDTDPVSEPVPGYTESLSKIKNSPYLVSNLKLIRNYIHATQESFGRIFGVTRDAIASYERGFKPKLPFLNDLTGYFDITMDELTGYDLSEHTETLEKISFSQVVNEKDKKKDSV